MRRLLPFIACLLAVFWLPATSHCGLETAGLWMHDHEGESSSDCSSLSCDRDLCESVEEGAFKNSTAPVKVNAPLLAVCVTRLVLLTAADAHGNDCPVSPATTDSPPELARTWQFSARTALLPGAPSLLA